MRAASRVGVANGQIFRKFRVVAEMSLLGRISRVQGTGRCFWRPFAVGVEWSMSSAPGQAAQYQKRKKQKSRHSLVSAAVGFVGSVHLILLTDAINPTSGSSVADDFERQGGGSCGHT